MGTMQRRKREAKDLAAFRARAKVVVAMMPAIKVFFEFYIAAQSLIAIRRTAERRALGLPEPEALRVDARSAMPAGAFDQMLSRMNDDLAARGSSLRFGS